MIALLYAVALQASAFDTAATEFVTCLRASVQMGMTTHMDPARFRALFADSCREEEARFRSAAIRAGVEAGKTESEAAAEVDANIANGRRIFAADQESYIRTGRVPH